MARLEQYLLMDSATRMSDQPSSEEMARLRALVPLHTLPDEALEELLETAGFESVAKGSMLFEEGDTDHENIYLLQGSVALLNEGVDRRHRRCGQRYGTFSAGTSITSKIFGAREKEGAHSAYRQPSAE